jgi:hypothetical protein
LLLIAVKTARPLFLFLFYGQFYQSDVLRLVGLCILVVGMFIM